MRGIKGILVHLETIKRKLHSNDSLFILDSQALRRPICGWQLCTLNNVNEREREKALF